MHTHQARSCRGAQCYVVPLTLSCKCTRVLCNCVHVHVFERFGADITLICFSDNIISDIVIYQIIVICQIVIEVRNQKGVL